MTDKSGERIDFSHMCVTTLGYLSNLIIPDKLTGWAGDLGSAMPNIKRVMEWNPLADINQVSEALVGQGDDYRSHKGLSGLILEKPAENGKWTTIGNTCSRDDLCCDGDAIHFAETLKAGRNATHLLSQTMRDYYNDAGNLANRFKRIATSMGANNQTEADNAFRNVDWTGAFLPSLIHI